MMRPPQRDCAQLYGWIHIYQCNRWAPAGRVFFPYGGKPLNNLPGNAETLHGNIRSGGWHPGQEFMIAILVGSTLLQFLAAFMSVRFVYHRRLGPPWLLVSLALLTLGGIRLYELAATVSDPSGGVFDSRTEWVSLLVSVLLVSGFALTERWFRLKERLEGRFRLLSEVDQSLIGVLDESRILSIVCEVLSRRKGYRLAWIASGERDGSVRAVKMAGDGEAVPRAGGIRWDDTPEGQGHVGKDACGCGDLQRGVDADRAEWPAADGADDLRGHPVRLRPPGNGGHLRDGPSRGGGGPEREAVRILRLRKGRL